MNRGAAAAGTRIVRGGEFETGARPRYGVYLAMCGFAFMVGGEIASNNRVGRGIRAVTETFDHLVHPEHAKAH